MDQTVWFEIFQDISQIVNYCKVALLSDKLMALCRLVQKPHKKKIEIKM